MIRICETCKQEKPLNYFHRDKTKTLGRKYVCKLCANAYYRKRDSEPRRFLGHKRYQQSERGKEMRKYRLKRDYWVNRHKYTAKKMVEAMVKTGEIVKEPWIAFLYLLFEIIIFPSFYVHFNYNTKW